MARMGTVEIRLADLPQVQAFLASVNALLTELAGCQDLLPDPVLEAVARLRGDAAALARDTAPQRGYGPAHQAERERRLETDHG